SDSAPRWSGCSPRRAHRSGSSPVRRAWERRGSRARSRAGRARRARRCCGGAVTTPRGHTPYGAFAEALDGWLAEHTAAERAGVGAEYPELASFLPSLGRAGEARGRSPEEERDRLFRASTMLLADLATRCPVLVVLDDLHAADTGSFQLLSHLARRSRDRGTALRFLVTYREEEVPEGDARRAAVTALLRQRLAVREEVARLGERDCLAVARDAVARDAVAGDGVAGDGVAGAPDGDWARRAWELSLGNPLFAVELARGLAEDPGGAGTGRAPEGVRELVAGRLARLDPDARRVVEALSVAGGEAALSELLDVAAHGLRPPLAGHSAAEALERAVAASIVEEREVVVAGRPEEGLAFRHPLVRLTCYERLSAARRRGLHAAFARAVAHRRPDAVDTLASHYTRADDPRAADYLCRAAERAAGLYANDTADRYYRDLVARLDVDAARARLAHAHVLRRMGDYERAVEVLRLALAEFERRGEHDDTVHTAALLAETLGKTSAPAAARRVLREHPVTPDTAPARRRATTSPAPS
ncbi:AAA ATPase domain-containing protein, partial [Streptomyces sp. SolWspMP-sol7th]